MIQEEEVVPWDEDAPLSMMATLSICQKRLKQALDIFLSLFHYIKSTFNYSSISF